MSDDETRDETGSAAAEVEQPQGEDRGGREPAPAEEAAPAETGRGKRLPRAERKVGRKPARAKAKERAPIVRLPKPVKPRGRRQERRGVVVSAAMDKTIVVRVDTLKAHPRYKKIVRRSTKFHVHDERNEAKVGDVVRIVETRPLSRTKRWRLVEIVEAAR